VVGLIALPFVLFQNGGKIITVLVMLPGTILKLFARASKT
jgi:hypothetical protein